MKNFIYKCILLFLILCMIQKPEFFFIPQSNNTFFGMLGFLSFLFGHEDRRNILSKITLNGKPLVAMVFPFVLIAVVAIVYNMSFDLRYVKYIVTLFFAFWASYLITVMSYRAYGKFDIGIFIKYLLAAEMIYIMLSVLMFFSSGFNSMALSLLKMDSIMMDAVARTSGFRILGFGAIFFTSGIMNGFILILMAIYMVENKLSNVQTLLFYTIYIFITVVGMMMARTALVGSAIGLAIICCHLIKDPKAFFRTLLLILLAVVAILIILAKVFEEFASQLNVLFAFAFEMFYNLAESGSMSTSSTDTLMTMYDIIPNTFKSWVIGDAKWDTAIGYYKGTDVGYLRNIWYFGIVGMVALVYYYYQTLKIILIDRNPGFARPGFVLLILFGYVLLLNLKGPADLFFYVIPLYFCSSQSAEEVQEEEEQPEQIES